MAGSGDLSSTEIVDSVCSALKSMDPFQREELWKHSGR